MPRKGELRTDPSAASVKLPNDFSSEAECPVFAEDHEAIARLAYSYWQARGCPIGSPDEDWYRAANELRRPLAAAAA